MPKTTHEFTVEITKQNQLLDQKHSEIVQLIVAHFNQPNNLDTITALQNQRKLLINSTDNIRQALTDVTHITKAVSHKHNLSLLKAEYLLVLLDGILTHALSYQGFHTAVRAFHACRNFNRDIIFALLTHISADQFKLIADSVYNYLKDEPFSYIAQPIIIKAYFYRLTVPFKNTEQSVNLFTKNFMQSVNALITFIKGDSKYKEEDNEEDNDYDDQNNNLKVKDIHYMVVNDYNYVVTNCMQHANEFSTIAKNQIDQKQYISALDNIERALTTLNGIENLRIALWNKLPTQHIQEHQTLFKCIKTQVRSTYQLYETLHCYSNHFLETALAKLSAMKQQTAEIKTELNQLIITMTQLVSMLTNWEKMAGADHCILSDESKQDITTMLKSAITRQHNLEAKIQTTVLCDFKEPQQPELSFQNSLQLYGQFAPPAENAAQTGRTERLSHHTNSYP